MQFLEFLGSAVVRTQHFSLPGTQIQSVVRELRSSRPHKMVKKKKKTKETYWPKKVKKGS